jgi:hypothetical protein
LESRLRVVEGFLRAAEEEKEDGKIRDDGVAQ